MSIILVKATVECDGCGKQFHTEMQDADRLPDGWTLYDLAADFVRGGSCVEGGICSVQHDLHLCPPCTLIADGIGNEDEVPTREQIKEAIEAEMTPPVWP